MVTPLTNEAGGKVLFSCPPGHSLIGSEEASCQPSSQWDVKESINLALHNVILNIIPDFPHKVKIFWMMLGISIKRDQV